MIAKPIMVRIIGSHIMSAQNMVVLDIGGSH